MLTESQCIEIAEKVWGWKYQEFGGKHWESPDSSEPISGLSIPSHVNSWEGFGRTVEAMRAKEKEWPWFLVNLQGAMQYENCIEKTHLAALEALK